MSLTPRRPLTVQPHPYIGDVVGRPLDRGMIYFGEPDKDPQDYPITVYLDAEQTKPAHQPIRTKGGFINVFGEITEIFASEILYSIKVLDCYGRLVYYKRRMHRDNITEELGGEIVRAQNAEKALQDNIDNEVNRAKKAEEELQGDINKEVNNRKSEVTRLEGIDDELQNQINSLGGGHLAYKTYAEMVDDAVNIPANSSIDIIADADDLNGSYLYDGASFIKSQYDLEGVIRSKVQNIFETYDEMILEGTSLKDRSYAFVADDVDSNNGFYTKKDGAWVESKYNPLLRLNRVYKFSDFLERNLEKETSTPEMTVGFYLDSQNAEIISNVNHKISDYIPVNPNADYLVKVTTTQNTACGFYDINKVFVGFFSVDNDNTEILVSIPDNVYFVRLSTRIKTDYYIKPVNPDVISNKIATVNHVDDLIHHATESLKEKNYSSELFDKNGYYITSNGEIKYNPDYYGSWYMTDYIPVKKGDVATIKTLINSSIDRPAAAIFNTDKEIIEIITVPADTSSLFSAVVNIEVDGFLKVQHATGGESVSSVTINEGLSKLISTERLAELITEHQEKNASEEKYQVLSKGAYSWWNEPQSCQIDSFHSKTVVGVVDMDWHKLVTVDNSKVNLDASIAYLKDDAFTPDAHNAAICRPAGDTLVVFQPSHNDVGYIPYRVSPDHNPDNFGEEKRLTSPAGRTSYSQVLYSDATKKLYVFFRSNGVSGWYLAECSDWLADNPVWDVHHVFNDTEQMYVRAVMSHDGENIRCLTTKNARYQNINGLWFANINLINNEISSTGGVVGSLGAGSLTFDKLAKVYDVPSGRIRLYDASTSDNKLPILLQTIPNTEDEGGPYRYVELNLIDGSINKDVEIVQSGKSLGTNFYYGGAHFSNILGGDGTVPDSVGPVYTAREDGGTWYIEKWDTTDNGFSWSKTKVIDSSSSKKLWRPRVPFNTRLSNKPNLVRLTWCKGLWNSYTNYNSDIYAYIK